MVRMSYPSSNRCIAKEWRTAWEQRTERLILRRGAHILLDGEVLQKGVDLGFGQVGRVADMVEEDEALDLPATRCLASRQAGPVSVALLGPATVVAGSQSVAKTIEKLWLLWRSGEGRMWGSGVC